MILTKVNIHRGWGVDVDILQNKGNIRNWYLHGTVLEFTDNGKKPVNITIKKQSIKWENDLTSIPSRRVVQWIC